MAVTVDVLDAFGLSSIGVNSFAPLERRPEGAVYINIVDADGDPMGGLRLDFRGVRDLITALEYAALYAAGEL